MDKKGVKISDCRKYRYQLWRIWDESKPYVLFIMLNPSTADADNNDPTIRRCIEFAKSWGYGGLYVGNLFAYRATNPQKLLTLENPIGEENLDRILDMKARCEKVVCAYGNVNKKLFEGNNPLKYIENLYCLGLTKRGNPKHPLYLKKDLKPIIFLPTNL